MKKFVKGVLKKDKDHDQGSNDDVNSDDGSAGVQSRRPPSSKPVPPGLFPLLSNILVFMAPIQECLIAAGMMFQIREIASETTIRSFDNRSDKGKTITRPERYRERKTERHLKNESAVSKIRGSNDNAREVTKSQPQHEREQAREKPSAGEGGQHETQQIAMKSFCALIFAGPYSPEGNDGSELDKAVEKKEAKEHESLIDESKIYFPLFVLQEPTIEYAKSFIMAGFNDLDVRFRRVPTYDGDQVMGSFRTGAGADMSAFYAWDVPQVYTYYKAYLRQPVDQRKSAQFTAFTFLAIDNACIEADPPQVLVCCDAPDLDEIGDGIALKELRIPLAEAHEFLVALEQLTVAPSEVRLLREICVSMHPSVWTVNKPDRETMGDAITATPSQARENRRAAIALARAQGLLAAAASFFDKEEGKS